MDMSNKEKYIALAMVIDNAAVGQDFIFFFQNFRVKPFFLLFLRQF